MSTTPDLEIGFRTWHQTMLTLRFSGSGGLVTLDFSEPNARVKGQGPYYLYFIGN